jgi:hypothetical protein
MRSEKMVDLAREQLLGVLEITFGTKEELP